MKVGVVARGKHGLFTAKTMEQHFDVMLFELPEELPEMIDISLPDSILNADVIISYAMHPDVNLYIVENSKAELVILTGKSGSKAQLKEIAEKRGIKLLLVSICCVTSEIPGFEEFFSYFGKPEFDVEVKDGKLERVTVKRCAFCGATQFVAEKVKGVSVQEAPRLAGYYTQIYPCLASRGIKGGIHLAAEMHKIAIEKAIKRANESSFLQGKRC